MPKIVFHPSFEKVLRPLPRTVLVTLREQIIPRLEDGTLSGRPLRGPLHGYFKCRLTAGGQSYRIVYRKIESETIFVVGIGKRGEFYQRLRRRLG